MITNLVIFLQKCDVEYAARICWRVVLFISIYKDWVAEGKSSFLQHATLRPSTPRDRSRE